ncbi:MAG: hypothetical protein D3909_10520 [Candidatus Electrothrix sp. ATG1]|nr:hypothetical protein [Candidatus Electrothrix sp. ATG1]
MKTKTKFTFTAITLFLFVCLPYLNSDTYARDATCAVGYYPVPIYLGYSLDWCKTFEHECGKPAADAFCQQLGYLSASEFSKKSNVQVETMTIQDNTLCNPQQSQCDSFSYINCKK